MSRILSNYDLWPFNQQEGGLKIIATLIALISHTKLPSDSYVGGVGRGVLLNEAKSC